MRTLFIIGLFLNSVFAFSQEVKYVNTESLNVRAGAGKQYKIINNVSQGEKLITYKTSGNWTEIELEGNKRGYVSSKFLVDNYSSNQTKENLTPFYIFIFILVLVVFIAYKVILVIKNGYISSISDNHYENSNDKYESAIDKQKRLQYELNNRIEIKQIEKNQKEFERNTKNQQELDKKNKIKQDEIERCERIKLIEKSKYICKNCGRTNKDLNQLTSGQCKESPTRKHQPFEGGIQDMYICKNCGKTNKDLNQLTSGQCKQSPTLKHQPFEGGIQNIYICKNCGKTNRDLNQLTSGQCKQSPTLKHQPLFSS